MRIGDVIVHDKVVGRKVVAVEVDGKRYTRLKLDSGISVEPMIEETEQGPKACLRMVIKNDPQKTGQTAGVGGQDPRATGRDEEDSEGSEGAPPKS